MTSSLANIINNSELTKRKDWLSELQKKNPFKELSDGLIHGGADLISLNFHGEEFLASVGYFYEWLDALKKYAEIDIFNPFHISDYEYDHHPVYNHHQVLFHIKTTSLSKILSGDEKYLPLLRVSPSFANSLARIQSLIARENILLRQNGFLSQERHPVYGIARVSACMPSGDEKYKTIDFTNMDTNSPEELKWGFEYSIIIPAEYSWLAYLFSKNYDLGSVDFFTERPKSPNNQINLERFISATKEINAQNEPQMTYKFNSMPSGLIAVAKEASEKFPVISSQIQDLTFRTTFNDYSVFIGTNDAYLSIHTTRHGDFGEEPAKIALKLSSQLATEKETINEKIYAVFLECSNFLKDKKVKMRYNADIKDILGLHGVSANSFKASLKLWDHGFILNLLGKYIKRYGGEVEVKTL